jgi:hypothetical protein
MADSMPPPSYWNKPAAQLTSEAVIAAGDDFDGDVSPGQASQYTNLVPESHHIDDADDDWVSQIEFQEDDDLSELRDNFSSEPSEYRYCAFELSSAGGQEEASIGSDQDLDTCRPRRTIRRELWPEREDDIIDLSEAFDTTYISTPRYELHHEGNIQWFLSQKRMLARLKSTKPQANE